MKVVFSDQALTDLIEIAIYIAQDNPARAMSFVDELEQKCLAIGNFPTGFPVVSGFESAGYRRRVAGNFVIFYRIAEHMIFIVRIMRGARDYAAILFDSEDF